MLRSSAITPRRAGGYLEMNVYKPLIIFNITHSIVILSDAATISGAFSSKGPSPISRRSVNYVDESLMLATALSLATGYDKASKIVHHAMDHDLTLKLRTGTGICHGAGVRSRRGSGQDGPFLWGRTLKTSRSNQAMSHRVLRSCACT